MLAACTQPDALEVLVEPAQHAVRIARSLEPGETNEIIGQRLATDVALEAFELPRRENLRERRVHRHLARVVGLRRFELLRLRRVRLLDHELAERSRHRVIVAPLQRGSFSEAHRSEEHDRVHDATVIWNLVARRGDDGLNLVAREHRRATPRSIFVLLLGQLVLQHARARREELVGNGIVQHRAQRSVDVEHGPRCDQLVLADRRSVLAEMTNLFRLL
ncbi:MAG: hypothetical protein QM831_12505 [Kofleriaceae bacterium]